MTQHHTQVVNAPAKLSEQDRRAYSLAYTIADENQRAVYLVEQPKSKYEYQERLAYVVFAGEADEYEKANGELIQPRKNVNQ